MLKIRVLPLLIFIGLTVGCGLAGTTEAMGQRLPKATGRDPGNKPPSTRRDYRNKTHQPAPSTPRNPALAESDNFLKLGDYFREQKKWKAAEAAYQEAVNVWAGNADALIELGFLYLDKNRIDEAQQTYGKLRSVNAPYAAKLLSEINRLKAALAH